MRRTAKISILIFFLLLFLTPFKNAFASLRLEPGDLQLEVNSILLDIENISIIDDIAFSGSNNFIITISSDQEFTVSSSEKRSFTVSPSAYSSVSCESSKSILRIDVPTIASTQVTITLGSPNTCSGDGGGGGDSGGGAGGGVGSPGETVGGQPPGLGEVVPPPSIPPVQEVPPTEIPPLEIPPIEIPPVTVPPEISFEETPSEVSLPETVQSVQTIGSGAFSIGGSLGEGLIQVFQGLTGGQKGSANIVVNLPNSGIYIWNTKNPLLNGINSNFKEIIEGNDYTIGVSSASLPNIMDISNSYFSFAKTKSLSLSNFKNTAYLLESAALTAKAQENQSGPSIQIISPNGGEVWNIGGTYEIKWTSSNLDLNQPINIALYKEHVFFGIKDAAKVLKGMNDKVSATINELRKDKAVINTVKNVAVPISVTVTAASAGALTVTATAGSATFALNLSEFFQVLSFSRFYLLGLIRFKKKKPWGKISNKLTGETLGSATVQIYEAEFKKLKDSQITDEEGRFGALVGPGRYYIKVSKKGFQTFQSDIIEITSPDQILNFEFYLSPIVEEWNLEALKKVNILNAFKRFVDLINPYLLAFGTIVSIIAVVIIPSRLNYGVFYVYIILDLLKLYFSIHLLKPFGKVIDETTNEALPLTVVRIFEKKKNWLLATKVTDDEGRFNFLLAPGQYYLTFTRAGYEPFHSDTIVMEKAGLPTLNVKMKRTA